MLKAHSSHLRIVPVSRVAFSTAAHCLESSFRWSVDERAQLIKRPLTRACHRSQVPFSAKGDQVSDGSVVVVKLLRFSHLVDSFCVRFEALPAQF